MSMHMGRLWLVPDRDTKLRVEIHLDSENIKIASNDTVIGNWPIADVEVREVGINKVRFFVEGEEVIVASRDPQFMPALLEPLGVDQLDLASQPSVRSPSSFADLGHDEPEPISNSQEREPTPNRVSRQEDLHEVPRPDSRSVKGAHRATRRLFWRDDPSTR